MFAALTTLGAGGRPRAYLSPPPATSAAGQSETYLWRPVAIGGGGFVTGYASDRTGQTRVARSDVYGAYIWQPASNRWTQLVTTASMPANEQVQNGMAEGVFEIVPAPSDPARLYMAVKGGVYRSDNRGATWTRPATSAPFPLAFDANSEFRLYGPFMAVSPANRDLVFLGTPANGLWRSTDGGVTWSKINTVPDGRDLRPDAGVQSPGVTLWFEKAPGSAVPGRIWAMSAGNGMFASSDAGAHFTALSAPGAPQPTTVKQGSFAADGSFFAVDAEGQSVWRYRAGSWVELTAQSGLAPNWTQAAVAVDPQSSDVYVFDQGGTAFRSTTGGASWQALTHRVEVGPGDPPWLRLENQYFFTTGMAAVDPVVPGRLWLAAGSGVYFADVTAAASEIAWISQTRGIEELVANDVIQPTGQAPLFAGWDAGVHRKDDLNAYSTTHGPTERFMSVQQLDWSPSNPAFIVTNASDTRIGCCSEDGNAVLAGYSLDGGRTWSRFATLPQPPGTAMDDPWRMSFGTIAVSAGDIDNIVWAPSFNRSPFVTTDRGNSWSRVSLPGEQLPATGSHSQYWSQRKTLAADRVRSGVFYLVHGGDAPNSALAGLWRTVDGGAHWQQVFVGEIAPGSRYTSKLRAVPGQANHLFFTSGVADAADTRLRRSIDGGATWSALIGVDRVDDIAFGKTAVGAVYPTIFLSGRIDGRYGLWRSVDDAVTWVRIAGFPVGTLDAVTVLEADKSVFGRVYVGYKGSGWIYGEPAACQVEPYRQGADRECAGVLRAPAAPGSVRIQ